jgi:hypothetical protein
LNAAEWPSELLHELKTRYDRRAEAALGHTTEGLPAEMKEEKQLSPGALLSFEREQQHLAEKKNQWHKDSEQQVNRSNPDLAWRKNENSACGGVEP